MLEMICRSKDTGNRLAYIENLSEITATSSFISDDVAIYGNALT